MNKEQQQRTQAVSDISRAHRAEELLSNSLHVEAFTAMQAEMFMEFQDTKLDNSELRHELWQRMQLLKKHQNRYESIVKQGTHAQKTLSMLDKVVGAFRI